MVQIDCCTFSFFQIRCVCTVFLNLFCLGSAGHLMATNPSRLEVLFASRTFHCVLRCMHAEETRHCHQTVTQARHVDTINHMALVYITLPTPSTMLQLNPRYYCPLLTQRIIIIRTQTQHCRCTHRAQHPVPPPELQHRPLPTNPASALHASSSSAKTLADTRDADDDPLAWTTFCLHPTLCPTPESAVLAAEKTCETIRHL